MRMKAKVLAPGVHDSNSTGFTTIMGVAKTAQGIPGTGEKQIVIYLCIPEADIIQAMGNGKDNMVMPYRELGILL